jgi:hypothetical protein
MSSPRRRRSNGFAAILGGLLAVSFVAGCGGGGATSSVAGSGTAASQSAGSSVVSKKTAVGASGGVRGGASNTGSAASAPASIHGVRPVPSGRLLRRFTGSGDARLGTIVVHGPCLLVWNASGPAIQIFTSSGFMLVNSHVPNGTVQLSRGTYLGVRVASAAGWSIELRSRSS